MRKPVQLRIEDVCIWRKALAECPDETMTILVSGLRILASSRHPAEAEVAAFTLKTAGFETGIKESK